MQLRIGKIADELMKQKYKKKCKNIPKNIPVKHKRRQGKKLSKRSAVISTADIKLSALGGGSIAAAEEQLGVPSLNKLFKKKPELKKAWERGIFLHNIADFAATATTIAEAGIELKLEPGQLEKIFAEDSEIAETWNTSRHNKRIEIKKAFMAKAIESCSLAAIKQMDKLLGREIAHPALDFSHINTEQMMTLTGRSRQTLQVDWPNKGLSRNGDGTYNLLTFFGWFEDFTIKKLAPVKVEGETLADEKMKNLKLDRAERLGQLLKRDEVITGLVARDQTILDVFKKHIDGQKELFIKQALEKILEEIRRELSVKIFDMKLDEEQSRKLKDLLDGLMPAEVEL